MAAEGVVAELEGAAVVITGSGVRLPVFSAAIAMKGLKVEPGG